MQSVHASCMQVSSHRQPGALRMRSDTRLGHPPGSGGTGISHRSAHTSLRIRGRRRTRVESPHHLGVIHLRLSHLPHDLSHHHYDISPHHPLEKPDGGRSVQDGVEFYISAQSLSVLKSLHNRRRNKHYSATLHLADLSTPIDFNKHSLLLPPLRLHSRPLHLARFACSVPNLTLTLTPNQPHCG